MVWGEGRENGPTLNRLYQGSVVLSTHGRQNLPILNNTHVPGPGARAPEPHARAPRPHVLDDSLQMKELQLPGHVETPMKGLRRKCPHPPLAHCYHEQPRPLCARLNRPNPNGRPSHRASLRPRPPTRGQRTVVEGEVAV